MDNFKSYITLIENQWHWRIDDQYGSTYKSTLNETEVYNVLEPFLENKRTMVQAGGNCGMHVYKFVEHFDTIYTFEPDPLNFFCLVNNLPYSNVIKIQGCLSDENKLVEIEKPYGDIGSIRINKNVKQGKIPCFTIDELKLDHCDLIQLDIEGYEMFALKGAKETIKKFHPLICIEYVHFQHYGTDNKEVDNFLFSNGYELVAKYVTDRIYKYVPFNLRIS
jgi:FkbM family methyltransferase